MCGESFWIGMTGGVALGSVLTALVIVALRGIS